MNNKLNAALKSAWILGLVAVLNSCVMLDEITQKFNPKTTVESVKPPANWQATLPHGGEVSNLNEFWQRYPDAVLLEMIAVAQKNAPTLATATANLAEARANRVSANAARLPKLDANVSYSRALQQPENTKFSNGGNNFGLINVPLDTAQVGLQASWELDLYGKNKILTDAAIKQETAAKAGWHDARVAVAAEVATSYFNYLLCQQLFKTQNAVAESSFERV
jgi:outer membrane protein, multidrug efflux system